MLKVVNLSKTFHLENQDITSLHDINFEVNDGEFFTLVGPSGCGKSTLLRILAGLTPPSSGQVLWSTTPKIGFVFQNYALFPYLTVFDNIAFGLKMAGVDPNCQKTLVSQLISEVGLDGFADKHPKELSGGMKQRVGIARALAIDPSFLFLDEPFSSLDEFTAENLRQLLIKVWQKREMTVVMVTHLIREALEVADQIAVMSSAPGKIKQIITNSLPRPRNLRSTPAFILEDKILKEVQR